MPGTKKKIAAIRKFAVPYGINREEGQTGERRRRLIKEALERLPTERMKTKAKKLLKTIPKKKLRFNDDGQIIYANGETGSALFYLLEWYLADKKQRFKIERPWDMKIFINTIIKV